MGEEKHNNCGEVYSSTSMKKLADQMLVLNLSLSRWCGFAFVFLELAADLVLLVCQELETNS